MISGTKLSPELEAEGEPLAALPDVEIDPTDLPEAARDRRRLRRLLLEGMESPPGPPADARYFEVLRSRIRRSPRTS